MQIPPGAAPPMGPPFHLLPAAAPPSPFPLQSSLQLRQHLTGILDNVALLKALADELEAVASVKAAQATQNVTVHDDLLQSRAEDGTREVSSSSYSCSLLKAVEERGPDLQSVESLALEAASSLQQSIETHLAPLLAILKGNSRWEDAAAVARMADRQLKTRRNRRWRKRRRQRAAEALHKERERYDQADQEADEWRAREIAKGIARRKMEKMKEVAKQNAKEDRRKLEEELELVLIVEKLQELRALRIQKLKKQGCFIPEEDNRFMERVRAAVEEEERQAAAAADTSATVAAIANAEEAGKAVGFTGLRSETQRPDALNENLRDQTGDSLASSKEQGESAIPSRGHGVIQNESANSKGEASKSLGQDGYVGLPAEFYHYYHGSNADMGTLIEVRRTWDTFILPGGSRIPGHWIEPPPPADAVWASYLIDAHEKG